MNIMKNLIKTFFLIVTVVAGFMVLPQERIEAADALSIELNVESTSGSGAYINGPATRQNGQTIRYEVKYATTAEVDNGVITIVIPDPTDQIRSFNQSALTGDIQSLVYSTSGTNKIITVTMKKPLTTGKSGIFYFELNTWNEKGPSGSQVTPTATITGKNNATGLPINTTITGPTTTLNGSATWTVDKKRKALPTYTSDGDAYWVEYQMTPKRSEPWDAVGTIDSSIKIVDQLPNIPGLTPEIVFITDGGTYNPATKQVVWEKTAGQIRWNGYTFIVRVKYPKAQIDALPQGVNTDLTNVVHGEVTTNGGVSYNTPDKSLTVKVDPLLTPTRGSLSGVGKVGPATVSQVAFETRALSQGDTITLGQGSTANVIPKKVTVTDSGYTFTKTDTTTYQPGAVEGVFAKATLDYLGDNAQNVQWYYRTSHGGTWIDGGTDKTIMFPAGALEWKAELTNFRYPVTASNCQISLWYTLNQRSTSDAQLSKLTNNAVVDFDFDNIVPSVSKPVSVDTLVQNGKTIAYSTSPFPANYVRPISGSSLSPNRQGEIIVNAKISYYYTTVAPVNGHFSAVLLPPEFTFNGNVHFNNGYAGPYRVETVPNFEGTGQTLVRVYADYAANMLGDVDLQTMIGFDIDPLAELKEYNFPTWVGLNEGQARDTTITEDVRQVPVVDIYDVDKDGDKTDVISGTTVKATLVSGTAATVVKMTKGPYDTSWKTKGSKVEATDDFQYRIFFRNDSPGEMTHLVMIDVLPYAGDVDPYSGSSRGSDWAPTLQGPVVGLPAGATAWYSTSTTPIMAPVGAGGTGSWIAGGSVADWSTIRAIKVDFGNKIFASGQSQDFFLDLKVPNTPINSGNAANNSVDYNVDAWNGTSGTPLLTASSDINNVYYRIPSSQIGDFVWFDTNVNGIQDAGELGINSVQVQLYSDVDGYASAIQTTTTINHPVSGLPGYYLFDDLRQGNYKVKFPVDATHTLTLQKQGSDISKDSDPNQATGWTDVIALLDDQNLLTIDAGYAQFVAPIQKELTSGSPVIKAGDTVSYKVTVTADKAYTNYVITDMMTGRATNFDWVSMTATKNGNPISIAAPAIADGMTYNGVGALAVGDVIVLQYSMKAKSTIAVGKYSNVASATLDGVTVETPPVEIIVPITKGANETAIHRGESVTYTVTFENATGKALSSWSLADVMTGRGANFDLTALTINGTVQTTPISADTLTFTGGALAKDQKIVVVYTLQAKTTANLVTYINTATVTLDGKPYAEPPVNVVVNDDPLKKVAKSGQTTVEPGQNVTYTVTLTADKAYTNYTIIDVMAGRATNFDWVSMSATKNGSTTAIAVPTFADAMTYIGAGALVKNDVVVIEYTLKAKNTIAVGTYSNTATAILDGKNYPTPPVDVTVPIIKTANKTSLLKGDQVTYTVTFKNGTGKALASWSLADVMVGRGVNFDVVSATIDGSAITTPTSADSLTFTGGALAKDQQVILTYVLEAKATSTVGTYTNTATVTLDGKPYAAPPVDVTIGTDPITKVADGGQTTVSPGNNVSYTLTLTADKAYAAYSVSDTMTGRNSNFTWVSGTVSINGGPASAVSPTFGDTMTFVGAGALAKNDVVVFKYTLKAKDTIVVGTYSNTATAILDGKNYPTPPVDVTVPIIKTANKTSLLKGDQVTYTVTFKNGTGKALASWSLADVMVGRGVNFDVISATVDGSTITTPTSADSLTFTGGALAKDQQVILTYVLEAKATSTVGTYTNTATVTLDGKPYAAPPVDVTIGTDPITKVADGGQTTVSPGNNVSYTLTLTADKVYAAYSVSDTMTGRNSNFTWVSGTVSINGGPASAVSPTFGDTMTFAGAGALAKNDVVVFKYTLKAKDTIAVGTYSNTATAILDGKNYPTPPVDVKVPIIKLADKATVRPGEQVTYTVEIMNTSSTAVSSYSIIDTMTDRDSNFTWVSGTISVSGGAPVSITTPVGNIDTLTFGSGGLSAGAKVKVNYTLQAKAGIVLGSYKNIAQVILEGTPDEKDDATVQVIDNPVKITGTVFEDVNNNGIWESATDIAINSHLVTLKDSTNTAIATTTTDANGFYSFSILINGAYTVEVDMTTLLLAGWTETTPNTTNTNSISSRAVAVAGVAVNNQNFGYNLKGEIVGYTLWDSDLTAVFIPVDMSYPIAASRVDLINTVTGLTIATTLTDANGKFVFGNVDPAGHYKIVVDNSCSALSSLIQTYSYDDMTHVATTKSNQVIPAISMLQPDAGPYIFGYQATAGDLIITKKAGVGTVRVGDLVPYTVTVENTSTSTAVNDVVLEDLIPAGFKYVNGSARLDKVKIGDPSGTRPIYFTIGTVNPSQKLTLTYFLVVGAGVQPGEYKNVAIAKDTNDNPKSNEATATVTVITDPLFDDSLVFGKVFVDKNGNNKQDKDEPGLGGVKLVTVRGEIITTDRQGRYHIPGSFAGRSDRGANFVLKLDIRSLPKGAVVTSENPRTFRNTPGVPSRINFAISLPPSEVKEIEKKVEEQRKVETTQMEDELANSKRISLHGVNFAFDEATILPEFENTLDQVIDVLKKHPDWKVTIEGHTDGIGSDSYNLHLSQQRADAIQSYLLSQGISAGQILDAKGLGKNQPVASNETPEGRYQNRRVDFVLQ